MCARCGLSGIAEMNPFFTLFLFAVSLLALAAAFSLMIYIAGELRQSRAADKTPAKEPEQISEGRQVSRFLSRMRASTNVKLPGEKRRIDSDFEKN